MYTIQRAPYTSIYSVIYWLPAPGARSRQHPGENNNIENIQLNVSHSSATASKNIDRQTSPKGKHINQHDISKIGSISY